MRELHVRELHVRELHALVTPVASPDRRRGFSLIEVLVGLAVLSLGLIPVLSLYRGARGLVGQSREILLLEIRTLAALDRARLVIEHGELLDLPEHEERKIDLVAPDARSTVTISRVTDAALFLLVAKSETGSRYFQAGRLMPDPLGGVLRPASPLPEPESAEGSR